MPHFSSRSRQAVLAGLVLLAGPAAAQLLPPGVTPPPPLPPAQAPVTPPTALPAPTAPPAVAAPGVDPKVTALFTQAIAAHQALTMLSAAITATSSGLGADSRQTITLAFQKPGKARIAVAGPAGPIVKFISDGKKLIVYTVHDKKYRADPVPPGADVIPAVLAQAHALLPRLIGQPAALNDLLVLPGVTASLGSPATVSGIPTETVQASLPAPDGSRVQFTLAFGSADHLLRRLIQTAAVAKNGTPSAVTHTETVTSLTTTPTLTPADFGFVPPPGVTKVTATAPQAGPTAPPQEPTSR